MKIKLVLIALLLGIVGVANTFAGCNVKNSDGSFYILTPTWSPTETEVTAEVDEQKTFSVPTTSSSGQPPAGVIITTYEWSKNGTPTGNTGSSYAFSSNNEGQFTVSCEVALTSGSQKLCTDSHSWTVNVGDDRIDDSAVQKVFPKKDGNTIASGFQLFVGGQSQGSSWDEYIDASEYGEFTHEVTKDTADGKTVKLGFNYTVAGPNNWELGNEQSTVTPTATTDNIGQHIVLDTTYEGFTISYTDKDIVDQTHQTNGAGEKLTKKDFETWTVGFSGVLAYGIGQSKLSGTVSYNSSKSVTTGQEWGGKTGLLTKVEIILTQRKALGTWTDCIVGHGGTAVSLGPNSNVHLRTFIASEGYGYKEYYKGP